jgi:aminoglycoside phosphotransferase (APT) family kinase protein
VKPTVARTDSGAPAAAQSDGPVSRCLPASLARWLAESVHDDGPFTLSRLSGGNSNETYRLVGPAGSWIVRRPPAASIARAAHNLAREHRVLSALADQPIPAPRSVAFTDDRAVAETPVLVLQDMAGTALTDSFPSEWPVRVGERTAVAATGRAAVEALAALHAVDWQQVGLLGFGRPDGYLARQVPRWRSQYATNQTRDLPLFDPVADWLDRHRPPDTEPALLHGDYHLDNCLFLPPQEQYPAIRVNAIIDWELATIGDPLVDLGLLLAFWGDDRPVPVAMPQVQALTRGAGAPSRTELADHYAKLSGRSIEHLDWYLTLALFKLAAIVEGAYARFRAGELDSDYARGLATDVPRLLDEAAGFAGL